MPKSDATSDKNSIVAVEECVRIFDREKRRKEILETKASTLLNSVTLIITILISVLGFVLSTSIIKNSLLFGFYVSGVVSLTVCMMLLILALRAKGYIDPFETDNMDELRPRFEVQREKLKIEIIKEYTRCFVIAFNHNNNKVKFLKFAEYFLITGIILIIISVLVLMCLSCFYTF